MSTIQVNGIDVISGVVTIPYYGAWVADIVLASSSTITPTLELRVGNLTMKGTVIRESSFAQSRSARIVGGYAGWRKVIPAKGYSHASGVKLSIVLGDAARACGEMVEITADRSLGQGWARESSRAEETLRIVTGGKWWMGNDGVTKTIARDTSSVSSPFTVVSWSGGKGLFEIATENVAEWMPGKSFESATVPKQTISSVSIEFDTEGKLRLSVMSTTDSSDRIQSSLRALIRSEIANLTYLGVWEYTIAGVSGTTISATPTDSRMPDITGCRMMPGLIGETVVPTVGSKCRISFVNGDPARFECIAIEGVPSSITVGASGMPCARLGDQVISFFPPLLAVVGTMTVGAVASPFVGTITIANPIGGVINNGSALVKVQ